MENKLNLTITEKIERLSSNCFVCYHCSTDYTQDHGIWLNLYGFGVHKFNERVWLCDIFCLEESLNRFHEQWKKEREELDNAPRIKM